MLAACAQQKTVMSAISGQNIKSWVHAKILEVHVKLLAVQVRIQKCGIVRSYHNAFFAALTHVLSFKSVYETLLFH